MTDPVGTAADVFVPNTARVCFAPSGTSLPTSTSGSLASFAELGYLSQDTGIVFTPTENTNAIVALQNGDTVAEPQTSHSLEVEFTCLETNEDVLAAWYSGNYDTPAGRGVIKGGQIYRGVWVIDAIMSLEIIRFVIPDGKVKSRAAQTIKNGEAFQYGFTLSCFPDASGNKSYDYHAAKGAS